MDVRLQSFAEAQENFSYLANVDMGALSATLGPRLIDGLQNGKAQNFQYTLELCWKAIKVFVKQHEGSIRDIDRINDILEADTMLAERIETWFEEATREGEARLLAKQLERRFGPLPQAVTDRLVAATEAQLDAWGEAVLSAPSLDAIFGEGRH